MISLSPTGMKVQVDITVTQLQKLAMNGNDEFDEGFRLYAIYLVVSILLLIIGSLCIFLLLMNAAYKVSV